MSSTTEDLETREFESFDPNVFLIEEGKIIFHETEPNPDDEFCSLIRSWGFDECTVKRLQGK